MKVAILLGIFTCLLITNAEILADGQYFIRNVQLNLYWDICGESLCGSGFNNLFIYNYYGDEFQTFQIQRNSEGFYSIFNDISGSLIALTASTEPLNGLEQSLYFSQTFDLNNHNQQFRIIPRSGGNFMIKPRSHFSLALESSPETSSDIYLTPKVCDDSLQLFAFQPTGTAKFAKTMKMTSRSK